MPERSRDPGDQPTTEIVLLDTSDEPAGDAPRPGGTPESDTSPAVVGGQVAVGGGRTRLVLPALLLVAALAAIATAEADDVTALEADVLEVTTSSTTTTVGTLVRSPATATTGSPSTEAAAPATSTTSTTGSTVSTTGSSSATTTRRATTTRARRATTTRRRLPTTRRTTTTTTGSTTSGTGTTAGGAGSTTSGTGSTTSGTGTTAAGGSTTSGTGSGSTTTVASGTGTGTGTGGTGSPAGGTTTTAGGVTTTTDTTAGGATTTVPSSSTVPTSGSTGSTTTLPPCTGPDRFQLVFRDDFDGDALGPGWARFAGTGHDGFGELRPEAVTVSGGRLFITAEMVDGALVSGGLIHSLGQSYGRYVVRVRTDKDLSQAVSGLVATWPRSGDTAGAGAVRLYETPVTDADRNPFRSTVDRPGGTPPAPAVQVHRADGASFQTMTLEWTPDGVTITREGPGDQSESERWTLAETGADLVPDDPHHLTLRLDAWKPSIDGTVRLEVDRVEIHRYCPSP